MVDFSVPSNPHLAVSFISPKHLDKPPTLDGLTNLFNHQFIGRNSLYVIDESSEVSRSPLFHCGDRIKVSLGFVNGEMILDFL